MNTLVIDPTVPPTQEQRDLLDAADPRHHQVFPAGSGIGALMAKVGSKNPSDLVQQPSAPALFLSLSYKAHRASKRAEKRITFMNDLMRSGLRDGGTFDFFEHRIQHVVFAYSALEAYANESIPDPFTCSTRRP